MYVKLTSGQIDQYPYTVGNLRRDNPNTSFPKRIPDEMLAEWGVYPVTITAAPSIDERTQKLEQDASPANVNGAWLIGWTTVDKTAEEVAEYDDNAAQSVRSQRDALLAETDWLVIKAQETGVAMSADMTAYKQALRDITTQEGFPHTITWPVKP